LDSDSRANHVDIAPIRGADRKEQHMNKRNNIFAGCSVVVALSAVGVGALVSSNAMAASEDPTGAPVTIGLISIADDGSAFECRFDAAEFPGFVPVEANVASALELSGVAPLVVDGSVTADGGAVAGGVVVESGPVAIDSDAPADLGDLEAWGTASLNGSVDAFQVTTGGEVEAIEVRQGTPAECEEAAAGAQP
jgi:hypothetical protein